MAKSFVMNKPGEPKFSLKLSPDTKIVFNYVINIPCTTELKIHNTSIHRQCFKVKCTDNEIFKVRPPLGFIEPNAESIIKITLHARSQPEENRHFFALFHRKVEANERAPKQCWLNGAKGEGVTRLIVIFEEIMDNANAILAEQKPETRL